QVPDDPAELHHHTGEAAHAAGGHRGSGGLDPLLLGGQGGALGGGVPVGAGSCGTGRSRGGGRSGRGLVGLDQLDVVGGDGGDEDVRGDELRERARRLARVHVDGGDALLGVDPDAGGAAAVDDGDHDPLVLDVLGEAVHGLAAGELGDACGHRVDAAARDGEDDVLGPGGGQGEPVTPAAASPADVDAPGAHDVSPWMRPSA